MRFILFAFFALLPAHAHANGLKAHEPSVLGADIAQTQAVQTNHQTGKTGDGVACGEAPALPNSEVSEGVGTAARADADAYAGRLSELAAKGLETVKELNRTYFVGEDLIKRSYYAAVCQRLAEMGIAAETVRPALLGLAQALDLAGPSTAEATPGQPPAAASGEKMAAASPPSATTAEPKVPETAPTAPEPAMPAAPTDIQPPSTPAEGAAPASTPRAESAQQQVPDTKTEQAPAGVAQDPAATEQKTETGHPTEQAATPEATQPSTEQNTAQTAPTPPEPSAPSPDQTTAQNTPAPQPPATEQNTAQNAPAPEQPSAPTPNQNVAQATSQPGAEQQGTPETSTMAQEHVRDGPPQGALTPGSTPEPIQSSPGSVEQPATAQTPAVAVTPPAQPENQAAAPAQPSAPAADTATPSTPPAAPAAPQSPAATAEAPGTPPPAQDRQAAEQPAAPQTSTMAQGEGPAGPPQGAITPGATPEPVQSSPDSVEQRSTAEAPSAAPEATAQATPQPAATQTAQAPAAPAPAAPAASPPETPAPGAAPPPAPVPVPAPAAATAPKLESGAAGMALLGEEECRALGVLTAGCPDLNNVLAKLLERPLEYNHPKVMYQYRKTEIGLVLRTDWQGKDLPPDVSEEMKNLPGEVQQGLTKVTRVMSAELSGRDFDIAPTGRQERTVIIPQPVTWNWQVQPKESGPNRLLKLQLYAHIEGPNGTMPPILIKTLDATINVDVRTWDWILAQVRDLEPIYAVIAALLGLLTAVLTYFFSRGSDAPAGGPRRTGGPVIGDLDQSSGTGQAPRSRGDDPSPEKNPD